MTNSTPSAHVVTRRLPLEAAMDAPASAAVCERLLALDGVHGVRHDADRRCLVLTYDTAVAGFGEIEALVRESGHALDTRWWPRLCAAWYRYLDENDRGNARAPGGACCSNPREVYARRRKP